MVNDSTIYQNLQRASQPFFSIIISTHNRARLIERALNSLVLQTESDWEAIIIDDESTDDTHDKVRPFLRSQANIKYIWKKHSGAAMTKNEGIRLSGGKFVTFLDSDDEYKPFHLKSRKSILMQNPSIGFLYGGAKILGNQYVPDRFDYTKRISLADCVIGGTFFIEKDTLLSLGGFRNMALGSDADLFARAKKSEIDMMETKISTYVYHHEVQDSITNKLFMDVHRTVKVSETP